MALELPETEAHLRLVRKDGPGRDLVQETMWARRAYSRRCLPRPRTGACRLRQAYVSKLEAARAISYL